MALKNGQSSRAPLGCRSAAETAIGLQDMMHDTYDYYVCDYSLKLEIKRQDDFVLNSPQVETTASSAA